jgi:hypothetical protein
MKTLIIGQNLFFDLFPIGGSQAERYIFILTSSLLSAVVFLILFKWTSSQARIKLHKRRISGNILQMRIYGDRLGLLFLSMLNILKHSTLYIGQTIPPLLLICIPLLLLMIQVNNRCGYQPIRLNQRFMIRVDLGANGMTSGSFKKIAKVYCRTSPGIVLETPPLRIESDGSVFWRARLDGARGEHRQYVRIGMEGTDQILEKGIVSDSGEMRFSPWLEKWSLRQGIFRNAEGFLPDDTWIRSITVGYDRARYPFLFWSFDSIVLYFLFTLLFSFALKGLFKVTL